MNRLFLFTIIVVSLLSQACDTLLYTSTIKMEVAVPAKVQVPPNFKNVAVRYNNINVQYNPKFAVYAEGLIAKTDTSNIDSIAGLTYFNTFIRNLKDQFLFDSVKVLEPGDYSGYTIVDTFKIPGLNFIDTTKIKSKPSLFGPLFFLSRLLKFLPRDSINENKKYKFLDPQFGLYTKENLIKIKDTTNADLLLSLDYMSSYDGIDFVGWKGVEAVFTCPYWIMYDLQKLKPIFYYYKEDTVYWDNMEAYNLKSSIKVLPKRKEAVLTGAEISAMRFVQFITPHWIEVERMYYKSGNKEMRKAEKLMKENKWLKAAEIWQKNVKNKHKSIAAKSMFNLALACEMEGQIDAAIDWTVKSFNVFKDKNEENYYNCMDYIHILSQRKLDILIINNHLNPVDESSLD